MATHIMPSHFMPAHMAGGLAKGGDPDHASPFLREGPQAVNLMYYTFADPSLLGDKVPESLKVDGCTMVVMWRGLFEVVPRQARSGSF